MRTNWLRTTISHHRRNPLLRRFAHACESFLAAYHNSDYEFDTNGERFVLQTLGRFPISVIFDVGANIGEWTRSACEAIPDARVHAFEISRQTFQRLEEQTRHFGQVRRVSRGLSDQEGTVKLHYFADLPVLTTALDFPHGRESIEITEPVTTGDLYCAAEGIGHIDFLKIDVEGMDHLVLRGFERMFASGGIDLVQFEYGQGNIVSRFLLRDFHDYFQARGFVVGKLYPNYVDFRTYQMRDEDFIGPNFVACRQSRGDYIQALSG